MKAHSCVEKNAKIALVQIRLLEPDQKTYALRGKILKEAIEKDIQDGLQPFFVIFLLFIFHFEFFTVGFYLDNSY